MVRCPHIETCALFPLFRLRGSLRVWQDNYCESEFARCARFQRTTLLGMLVGIRLYDAINARYLGWVTGGSCGT